MSALAYCHHKLFLLHRDIKPANIFLSRGGDVKIGDFGLSKSLAASHGLAQTKCGSPVYMSPELAAGRAYTGGCDVWALGCCLYEMMSLTTPWVEQHQPRTGIVGLMRLICTGTLDLKPLRAHYSAGLVELVGAMLAKRAADRPSFRSLLTHPVLKPMLEQMDARANQQPQPQPQPSQPQPSQPQPQPGAVGAPANPFEMRGPLARATPHATPQTTPRTSSPTGAVPIPARQHFDCRSEHTLPLHLPSALEDPHKMRRPHAVRTGRMLMWQPSLSSAHSSCCAIRKYPLRDRCSRPQAMASPSWHSGRISTSS